MNCYVSTRAFLVAQMVTNLQCRILGFEPWVGKIPWRRKWQPSPVFLPGKFHGQRSLLGYSPWGCKRVGHDLETFILTHSRIHLSQRNDTGRRTDCSMTVIHCRNRRHSVKASSHAYRVRVSPPLQFLTCHCTNLDTQHIKVPTVY